MEQRDNVESGEIADIDSYQEPSSENRDCNQHVFKPNKRVFRKAKHRLESTQSQDTNSQIESESKKQDKPAQIKSSTQIEEESKQLQSNSSNMILVRVKRPRDADDLDQIYMDYDTEGNFKRPKLVTEKDSMMSALSMFQIGASKPPPVAFSLGQKQNVVKLNKVSLNGLA